MSRHKKTSPFIYILCSSSCTTRCSERVAAWWPGRAQWLSTKGCSLLSFRSPRKMASHSHSTPSSRDSTNSSRRRQNRPGNDQVRTNFVASTFVITCGDKGSYRKCVVIKKRVVFIIFFNHHPPPTNICTTTIRFFILRTYDMTSPSQPPYNFVF